MAEVRERALMMISLLLPKRTAENHVSIFQGLFSVWYEMVWWGAMFIKYTLSFFGIFLFKTPARRRTTEKLFGVDTKQ